MRLWSAAVSSLECQPKTGVLSGAVAGAMLVKIGSKTKRAERSCTMVIRF